MGLGLVIVKLCDAAENLSFTGLESAHNLGKVVTVGGGRLNGGGLRADVTLRRIE